MTPLSLDVLLLAVCSCLNTPKQQTRQSRPSSAEMALLTSTTMRTCARPAAAPRAVVVTPRVVVCRAKTQEEALKAAGDLLQKGVAMATDAVKNVDTAQVRRGGHFVDVYFSFQRCRGSHWSYLTVPTTPGSWR